MLVKTAFVILSLICPILLATDQQPTQTTQTMVSEDTREQYLAEVKKMIEGKENLPAEQVFHNIIILKGKPASRLPGMMSALTGLIGVQCSFCHIPGHWEDESKTPKQIARQHFQMQKELLDNYFHGENKITCWTCHRGQPTVDILPPADK
jgi:Photosynthetic reaction centre cytochrome C subunit